MKHIKITLVFLLIVSCTIMDRNKNIEFNHVLEDYFQESLYLYKINGTFQGDPRYNDSLPNFLSDAFVKKEELFYNKFLKKINSFDNSLLNEAELLSKNVLNV